MFILVQSFSLFVGKIALMANVWYVKIECKDRKLPDWIKKWQDNPNGTQISDVDDSTVYCLCREPWQGRFMIQCDGCDEWFHGACVDITENGALHYTNKAAHSVPALSHRKSASTNKPVAFRPVHTGIEPPFLLKIYFAITACMTRGFTSRKYWLKEKW